MGIPGNRASLAAQARRNYVDRVVGALPALLQAVEAAALAQISQPANTEQRAQRREAHESIRRRGADWLKSLSTSLRHALTHGVAQTRPGEIEPGGIGRPSQPQALSLVDDDTIEAEIVSSRLSLAIMDHASWEFAELRTRVATLEARDELEPRDLLRAHVVARLVVEAWRAAGLDLATWRLASATLHDEFAKLVQTAYRATNEWLVRQGVLPEGDLPAAIQRTRSTASPAASPATPTLRAASNAARPRAAPSRPAAAPAGAAGVPDATPLTVLAPAVSPLASHADSVLGRFNRLVSRHMPGFADVAGAHRVSGPLRTAIAAAQQRIQQQIEDRPLSAVTTPLLIEELHQRKQALKHAAATQIERATIEVVALLFQSILTEDRLPAAVRVWFARLQMPVLRVAVEEPDFFATTDHPARRLIDRMGACVMGFDASVQAAGDALEKEIKRVVQVVEAYPDTGRRVFQTVLTEFEKFIEHYFANENEMSRKGISLAQQVEQRETLAIQYTIELRKMLNEVPVQEGVRNFLFQVWADVLAMTTLKHGAQSEETKTMKRAAADLIWSAGAKATRDERAEVIRRLPPLLKTLRDGMAGAGVAAERQEDYVRQLNNSLAAAFAAKAAVIPPQRLEQLKERLETLEELLPEAGAVEIDESLILDLSGHESDELEVVGGEEAEPTPQMLAWARELQVGSWFMLEYRGRNEQVQLAWQGLRRQLALFVSATGRCVLFQQHRLAAFLQSGLLVPAEDEALTVKATRKALEKLDADPGRLLH